MASLSTLGGARRGPLARCNAELEHVRRLAAFRRERELRSRRRLRESDLLLDLIERCRLRGDTLLPTLVWSHVVRFVGAVDASLRDDLGINRSPDHVSDVVFAAQEVLLAEQAAERSRGPAEIIQLFGEPLPLRAEG